MGRKIRYFQKTRAGLMRAIAEYIGSSKGSKVKHLPLHSPFIQKYI